MPNFAKHTCPWLTWHGGISCQKCTLVHRWMHKSLAYNRSVAVCRVHKESIIKKLPRTKNVVRKQSSNVGGRFWEIFVDGEGGFQEQKRKLRT